MKICDLINKLNFYNQDAEVSIRVLAKDKDKEEISDFDVLSNEMIVPKMTANGVPDICFELDISGSDFIEDIKKQTQTVELPENIQRKLNRLPTLFDIEGHVRNMDVEKAVSEILAQAQQEAVEKAKKQLLVDWQENHPQESLENAVKDSAKNGGVNSYGAGYDQGYLDCHNQVTKALQTKESKE